MDRSRPIPGLGVSANALDDLATMTRKALGSGPSGDDAETIIFHAVQQACHELEFIESTIPNEKPLGLVLHNIRRRLELALDNAHTIATIIKEAGRA